MLAVEVAGPAPLKDVPHRFRLAEAVDCLTPRGSSHPRTMGREGRVRYDRLCARRSPQRAWVSPLLQPASIGLDRSSLAAPCKSSKSALVSGTTSLRPEVMSRGGSRAEKRRWDHGHSVWSTVRVGASRDDDGV